MALYEERVAVAASHAHPDVTDILDAIQDTALLPTILGTRYNSRVSEHSMSCRRQRVHARGLRVATQTLVAAARARTAGGTRVAGAPREERLSVATNVLLGALLSKLHTPHEGTVRGYFPHPRAECVTAALARGSAADVVGELARGPAPHQALRAMRALQDCVRKKAEMNEDQYPSAYPHKVSSALCRDIQQATLLLSAARFPCAKIKC